MQPNAFDAAQLSFFQRNQTDFLVAGIHPLLCTSIPWIIQTNGTASVVINGLKYGFSLTNVRAYNSGVHISECFAHCLSHRIPITADFQFDVVPLLAADKQAPRILSQVRSVVLQVPIPTGFDLLSTPALEDPEIEDHTLHAGIFICGGHMRTIPCIKSMFNNTVLLMSKKGVNRLQVRADHEGNRTMDDGNPFRSTSSINFEVAKKLKRSALEGEITCKLPFSNQKVQISVLAQAFGCGRQQFIDLVKHISGKDYDAPTFRCYEIDILHGVRDIQDQKSAIMALSKLSNKNILSTGINLLKTEVFPHLNVMFDRGNKEGLYFMKLFYLAMCTSMLILFVAGKIKETSRDCWQYANVVMPAFQLGTLIRTKFINHMSMFAKLLRRELLRMGRKSVENQTHPDLVKMFGEQRLSSHIMSAVNNGAFSKKKQGVTIQLNDNNEDAVITQLLSVASSLKTTDSTHTTPRQVGHATYGYMCAASTPDGEKVGLNGELACTATITVDMQDPKSLCELIEYLLCDELLDMIATLKPQTAKNIISTVVVAPPSVTDGTTVNVTPVDENATSLSVELIRGVDFTLLGKDWYLFINNCGVPTHFVRPQHVKTVVAKFRQARRQGEMNRHCFIRVSHYPRQIRVMCEGGQVARPLVILENLKRIQSKTLTFWDMVQQEIIEYVNPGEEQTLCKVAVSFEDLRFAVSRNEHKPLTHLEFSQASLVGIMAASVVFFDGIQGPRLAYATHQRKQVMTAGIKRNRGAIQSTEIWYNHKELVYTKIAASVPEAKDGRGYPAIVAFLALDQNQEDAFITHKQVVDRGALTAMTTRHYVSDIKAPTNVLSERFEKSTNVLSRKHQRYNAIEPDGFPKKRAKIPGGEVVIAKTRAVRKTAAQSGSTNNKKARTNSNATSAVMPTQDQPQLVGATVTNSSSSGGNNSSNASLGRTMWISRRDISQVVRRDEGGSVRNVSVKATQAGKRGRVSVVTLRRLCRGDKGTSKHSQKGVCGALISTEDMPFSERTGLVPDIIVSPLGITSRMTMASEVEGLVGKAVAAEGDLSLGEDKNIYDGNTKAYLKKAGDYLVKHGFKRNGAEFFRCGKTGKRLRGEVFVGIIYYHQLIHIAEKKLHYRSRGPRCPLTRQSKQGKRHDGGLRWGLSFCSFFFRFRVFSKLYTADVCACFR